MLLLRRALCRRWGSRRFYSQESRRWVLMSRYKKGKYAQTAEGLIQLPLNEMVDTFGKMIPGLEDYGKDVVVGDLLCEMYKCGQGSLARQLLQEVGEDLSMVDDVKMVLDRQIRGEKLRFRESKHRSIWLQTVSAAQNLPELIQNVDPRFQALIQQEHALSALIRRLDISSIPKLVKFLVKRRIPVTDRQIFLDVLERIHDRKQLNPWVELLNAQKIPDDEVVNAFLNKALDLRETITASTIIKIGNGHFSIRSLSRAFESFAWAKRGKHLKNLGQQPYIDNQDVDTTMMRRVLQIIPTRLSTKALERTLHRWDFTKIPGRVLWTLFHGIEASQLKPSWNLQNAMVTAILERPRIEQIKFVLSPMIDASGVRQFINLYMSRVINRNLAGEQDLQVLLTSMKSLEEKSATLAHPIAVELYSPLLGMNEEQALTFIELFTKRTGSEWITIQLIALLLQRQKLDLVAKVFSRCQDIPHSAYNKFLSRCIVSHPVACAYLANWLERQNIEIPVTLLRKLAVEFGRSPLLNASQSIRYFTKTMYKIDQRGARLGAKAATALVEGVLARAKTDGRGSKARLALALRIAKRHKIPTDQWRGWYIRLGRMKFLTKGFGITTNSRL